MLYLVESDAQVTLALKNARVRATATDGTNGVNLKSRQLYLLQTFSIPLLP